MKGWGENVGRDLRIRKGSILAEIQALDLYADAVGLSPDEWALHYSLEDTLMDIYSKEEEYWRKRGSMNWILFGDAKMAYFQAIVNGRRRRCMIPLLWDGDLKILEADELQSHVDGFYKALFAGCPRCGIALASDIWG